MAYPHIWLSLIPILLKSKSDSCFYCTDVQYQQSCSFTLTWIYDSDMKSMKFNSHVVLNHDLLHLSYGCTVGSQQMWIGSYL